jgi:cysteine desulfurase/selenocysteine lyase
MAQILNPNEYRKDFPILREKIHGKPLVYLDNAATTQKPLSVINAVSDYYLHSNANVHRGIHTLAERATTAYEDVRKKAANFIGAATPKQIIYTRGTTESINLVAAAWGRKNLTDGDEIILTEMEHHSNLIPWHILAKEKKINLKFIPIHSHGTLNLDGFEKLISEKTKLISMAHMSNVLGTINPAAEIIKIAHSKNVKVLLDGAQSVPHLPVDVKELDCDFFAFSGHKMLGPTGIGILYAKIPVLEEMDPYQSGGEMIESVTLHNSTYSGLPHKFEAGTPNIAGAVGLGAAIDYLDSIGMEKISLYEQEITSYALMKMSKIEGMTIYGPTKHRGGAISFNLGNIHPHDMAHFLDQQGIAVRAGFHCAQPLMEKLKVSSTTRASLYFYNTIKEIDYFVDQLTEAQHFFKF